MLESLDISHARFHSVALNGVLHCLPGTLEQKAAAFRNLRPFVDEGGVVFGSTILGSGVEHGLVARKALALYNRERIFGNLADDLDTLRRLDPDRAAQQLPRLYRAARAWTRSREEAEDLVQETYARVLARPRLLRGDDETGYLLRAMRNTLISRHRAENRRPVTTELVEEAALDVRGSNDPAQAAEIREVYAAIAQLPEEFRDALVAVDVTGLSYPEAARALGVPEGTLTSRLFRARDRVARLLGEGG